LGKKTVWIWNNIEKCKKMRFPKNSKFSKNFQKKSKNFQNFQIFQNPKKFPIFSKKNKIHEFWLCIFFIFWVFIDIFFG
jgi:hypothetical protein